MTLFFKGFLKSENELLFLLPRIGCIAVGPREIHLQCFDQKEGFPNCNNELWEIENKFELLFFVKTISLNGDNIILHTKIIDIINN